MSVDLESRMYKLTVLILWIGVGKAFINLESGDYFLYNLGLIFPGIPDLANFALLSLAIDGTPLLGPNYKSQPALSSSIAVLFPLTLCAVAISSVWKKNRDILTIFWLSFTFTLITIFRTIRAPLHFSASETLVAILTGANIYLLCKIFTNSKSSPKL